MVAPVRARRDSPRPLALRCCAGALDRAGLKGGAVHLERILALALGDDPSAQLHIPGGSVRRQYELMVFSPGPDPGPPQPLALEAGEQAWGSWTVFCAPAVCPGSSASSPFFQGASPG